MYRVTAMTALAPGVGLIPLALGAGEPGREIQQPTAVVILGAIGASTFLNMIVIPALYLKFGGAEARVNTEAVGFRRSPPELRMRNDH